MGTNSSKPNEENNTLILQSVANSEDVIDFNKNIKVIFDLYPIFLDNNNYHAYCSCQEVLSFKSQVLKEYLKKKIINSFEKYDGKYEVNINIDSIFLITKINKGGEQYIEVSLTLKIYKLDNDNDFKKDIETFYIKQQNNNQNQIYNGLTCLPSLLPTLLQNQIINKPNNFDVAKIVIKKELLTHNIRHNILEELNEDYINRKGLYIRNNIYLLCEPNSIENFVVFQAI